MVVFQKAVFSITLLVICSINLCGQSNQLDYAFKYRDLAIEQMKRSGVPASIILAQAIIESDSGNSRLAREANNHFGIKCHNNWLGETISHDDDSKSECFRKYNDVKSSFSDHSDFLRYSDRYKNLFMLSVKDYKGWAYGLSQAGYATDPNYPSKLIAIIERFYLNNYDSLVLQDSIPLAPTIIEAPRKFTDQENIFKTISIDKEIFEVYDVPYIVANGLDTYSSLAKQYHLFTRELLRFNDLKKNCPIESGTVVFLQRKNRSGAKNLDMYITNEGESIYDISQRFAIQLKYLLKYNKGIKADHIFHQSDIVYLTNRTNDPKK